MPSSSTRPVIRPPPWRTWNQPRRPPSGSQADIKHARRTRHAPPPTKAGTRTPATHVPLTLRKRARQATAPGPPREPSSLNHARRRCAPVPGRPSGRRPTGRTARGRPGHDPPPGRTRRAHGSDHVAGVMAMSARAAAPSPPGRLPTGRTRPGRSTARSEPRSTPHGTPGAPRSRKRLRSGRHLHASGAPEVTGLVGGHPLPIVCRRRTRSRRRATVATGAAGAIPVAGR